MTNEPEELPEDLERLFAEARRAKPPEEALAALREHLGKRLLTPVPTPRGARPSSVTKVWFAMTGTLLGGAALWLLMRVDTPSTQPSHTVPKLEAPVARPPTPRPPSVPSRRVDSRPLTRRPEKQHPRPKSRRSTSRRTSQTSEARLLDRAQAALAHSPRRSLQLTRRHARRYPRGILVQEREAIAIRALLRLNRREAAEQRLSAFARKWPDSAHLASLRELLRRTADAEPLPAR